MTVAKSDTETGFSFETAPGVWGLLYEARRSPRAHGRRLLTHIESRKERSDHLLAASAELRRPSVANGLAAHELASLGRLAIGATDEVSAKVLPLLQNIAQRRWSDLGPAVVATALLDILHGDEVLKAFPSLVETPAFIDGLEESHQAGALKNLIWRVDLARLAAPTRHQLRRLLPAAGGVYEGDLSAQLLRAAAERDSWTPWLELFGVLFHASELAHNRAPETPPPRSSPSWRDADNEPVRQGVWAALRSASRAMTIARLIGDMGGALRDAPRDLWDSYVRQLGEAIADDPAWRAATVEALLWQGAGHNRRLAVYAADTLVAAADLPMLEGLFDHPDRRTQYEARALAVAIAERPVVGDTAFATDRPPLIVGRAGNERGLSNTWMGQALVEQLIAEEAAKLEAKFAKDYTAHHRNGEEKLAERFFTELGIRFDILSEKLAAMARESSADSRSEVLVRYRPIDKPEEGNLGIVRPGQAAPPKRFSADLCLVVEAKLNGASLARRATLVQAKRLYAADLAAPEKGWAASFRLKAKQTDALLRQTESSFYLFQGPGFDGRGVPIIPARLVDELATHQARMREVISTASVGRASQSFAEWFTYEVVALRTGDPLQALVDKAMGGPGSEPCELARFGVVEVEVRIGEPLKADS